MVNPPVKPRDENIFSNSFPLIFLQRETPLQNESQIHFAAAGEIDYFTA
jgi:hypothetical protein